MLEPTAETIEPSMRPPSDAPGKPRGKVSRKRRVLRNGFANWLGFVAQVTIAFVTTPFIVHGLGDARYGVWSLVESILAYLTLFDLGLTASVVRFTSKFAAIDDPLSRNRVINTSLALFGGIGLMALVVASVLAWIGPGLFKFPADVQTEGMWLFLLLGINIAIGLPLNIFPSILAGLERYTVTSLVRTIALVIRSAAMVAVVMSGGRLVQVGVVVTLVAIAESVALAIAVRRLLPDLRISPGLVDRETFRLIRGYSVDAFILSINNRISFKTDPMVISYFLGPQFITPYILGKRLVGYATSSLRAFTQVLTPAVSALDSTGDVAAIRRIMIDGTRFVLWAILPIELGLIILGKPFLALWMGDRLADLSYPTLVVLAVPLIFSLSQSVSTRILFGTSGLRWLSRTSLCQAGANLLISVLLAKPLGIIGVAIGTAVPNIVYNLVVEKRVCRQLDIGLVRFLRSCYLKPLAVAPIPILIWCGASRLAATGWLELTLVVAVGLVVYAVFALMVEFGVARCWNEIRTVWPLRKLPTAPCADGRSEGG